MLMINNEKHYQITINPRILELLGPSLYTNIYYVLAELIANSYDAGAKNVYIIEKQDSITVEDDGNGMSYKEGDIEKYLDVAVETRKTEEESYVTGMKRKRMGRKGVGKLAALSVSENVLVMTVKNNEKSGFVLSRHVEEDNMLKPLNDEEIKFNFVKKDGTSIVMTNPQYGLHKSAKAIKKNLLKIFPLINENFKIHIITRLDEISIQNFDKEMIGDLCALIILGKEYHDLAEHFKLDIIEDEKEITNEVIKKEDAVLMRLPLKNKYGVQKEYILEIKGWIGAYKTTRDRKNDPNDFPDNFISIISRGKLGEYNILPVVGKNKLSEVYIVGQLHIDLLEETELPDISLSNRQGYKTDDPRYQKVISYVSETLLPQIIDMRTIYAAHKKDEKDKEKNELQKKNEVELIRKIDEYTKTVSTGAAEKLAIKFKDKMPEGVQELIAFEINKFMPIVGIKQKVDSQKKRILISHTKADKDLADIIYKMLSYNGVPDSDVIYTNCDNEECWIPHGKEVFDYLRDFFVDSYSTEKIFVIYITSNEMASSWAAVSEVGAGWITQSKHDIFNVHGYTPRSPLNIGLEWHTSEKEGNIIMMNNLESNKFVVKIIDICKDLGYKHRDKESNLIELKKLISLKP